MRRTRKYRKPATSATTARIRYAYSIGIRWRASLLAVSLRNGCCEVCHSVSVPAQLQGPGHLRRHGALDQQPAGAHAGDADVGLERVSTRRQRLTGDHV